MPDRFGLRMRSAREWEALQRRIIDADPLCQGDPRWTSDDREERQQAAEMCIGCPVLDQCRDFAVRNFEEAHVWGGKDFTVQRRNAA